MALINCKECNHQISKKAKTCPNCGVKVKKGMSIVTLLLLGLVFLFVVAQFGNYNNAVENRNRELLASHTIISQTSLAPKSGFRIELKANIEISKEQCEEIALNYVAKAGKEGQVVVVNASKEIPFCVINPDDTRGVFYPDFG